MLRIAAPTGLLLTLLFVAACSSRTPTDETEARGPVDGSFSAGSPSAASSSASGNRIAILDHGFRMTRGTQVIPDGWKLEQDIATDPNTAQVARYHMELRGPGGELIKALGTKTYGQMFGTSFDQTLRQITMAGLESELHDISMGSLQRSSVLERAPEFQKAVRLGRERGLQVQGLEAPLQGRRDGNPVHGVLYVGHFTSVSMPGAGTVQASVVLSPPDRLEAAVRVNERMNHTYRANPAFEQRLEHVHQATMRRQNAAHQQRMATSRAQHQQRMASNQARFQSHQRMMQDRYDANDRQHEQWMNNFRSSGTSAWSGSDYTGHDAYIDGIHERSTFQDPYSGQQVHRDGQYDNWYTNGQGDYYGTDDPSFDPYSMQGDWQQIEPMRPNQ